MRTMNFIAIGILTLTLLALGAPSGLAADVALPEDVRVVAPDPSVPEPIRRFHGTWSGQWDDVLDHKLIVEMVDGSGRATVVYAWGDYPRWRVQRGWIRTTAEISKNKLTLKRAGDSVEYVLREDGALGGTYDTGYHRNYGTFRTE